MQRHAEGQRVVVFIEESQSMPLATLEEIRLLSNLETRNDKLLQIVLFGQPELDENLRRARHPAAARPHHAQLLAGAADRRRRCANTWRSGCARRAIAAPICSPRGRAAPSRTATERPYAPHQPDRRQGAARRIRREHPHHHICKHLRAAVGDSEFSGPSRYRQSQHWLYPAGAVLGALAVGVLIYLHEQGSSGAISRPRASLPRRAQPEATIRPFRLCRTTRCRPINRRFLQPTIQLPQRYPEGGDF